MSTPNDFSSVALTCVCHEDPKKTGTVTYQLHDPRYLFQFAYRPNRTVDGVVVMTLDHTLQHLDYSRTYVRILFLDCKSGTLGTQLALVIGFWTFLWTDHRWEIRIRDKVSVELTISTGTKQG